MTSKRLNKDFALTDTLSFIESKGGITIAMISNEHASAQISLYGAHVMSFEPNDSEEVLMMSSKCVFEIGTPLRGGIPICFPWFGPNKNDNTLPMHGFARIMNWKVVESQQLKSGETILKLYLSTSPATLKLWPYPFTCELTFTIGKKLNIEWQVTNNSNEEFEFSQALHSYFATDDISQINVSGFEGAHYLDALNQLTDTVEKEPSIVIDKEVNRCYLNTDSKCTLSDKGMNRKIEIIKTGSQSTVVWNPWIETSKKFKDLRDDEYNDFICIETANVHQNIITLTPGQSHSMSLSIAVLPLK